MLITKVVTVAVDPPYSVTVGEGVLDGMGAAALPRQLVVVSNPTVFDLYGARLLAAMGGGRDISAALIDDGEAAKNLATIGELMDAFTAAGLRRDGGVVALGGGVVGDVGGFAAAVYMRGVGFWQVPTTLLAQVDAAIGGKTGVNHAAGKNLIGAFYQPRGVFCDTGVLATLSAREFAAGLAEVVKYGLLGDAAFFGWLEANAAAIARRDGGALRHIVCRSAQIKAEIVAADEREVDGRRALLNLGHTFGHAIEQALGYGEWLHGEAVAAGLVAAARLSERLCGFAAGDTARVVALLRRFGLPVAAPPRLAADSLMTAMKLDKKNTDARRFFVVMDAVGAARLRAVDDAALLREVVAEWRAAQTDVGGDGVER